LNFRNPESIRKKDELKIELTPLIDVVFLLLIFFTITTTFVTTPGFRVKLPKAASSTAQSQKNDATVVITKDRKIIFENKEVDLKQFGQEVSNLVSKVPDTLLIVQADQEVHHGLVVEVMDIAKQGGIKRLAIATRAP